MAGAFSGKRFRTFWPPGAILKKTEKNTRLSHTATALQQQKVLVMSQPSSTEEVPSIDKSTDDHSTRWGKLTPSRSSGAHEGGHAGARSRACYRVYCAAGPTVRTTLSRLPSELCTGAFGRAEWAALLLDGDEAQGDRVHAPPMPRRRRRGKSWSDGRAGTGAVSEANQGKGSNRREDSSR